MASTRIRTNTLARIRTRQAKLNPNEKINILRGLGTRELKKIEKSLNAKISLSQAGVDTSGIGVLDPKARDILSQIGRSLKADAPVSLASAVNKLSSTKKAQIHEELKEIEGFGNVEFIREALKKPVDPKSKLIKADAKMIVEALFKKDFVESTIKDLVARTNNALRLQNLDEQQIVYDEFDLQSNIEMLNRVDQRTKNIARYVEFDEDIIDEDFTV